MSKLSFGVNLGLPASPQFVTDGLQVAEFQQVYNAINVLADSLFNLNSIRATAGVAIAAGTPCYLTLSGSVYTAQLAIATHAGAAPYTMAMCFCAVNGGLAAGEVGLFAFGNGFLPYVSGLTAREKYYLSSTTAGGIVAAAPVAAGTFVQPLGFAVDADTFYAKIANPIAFN
jgi:hypothetical protein